MRSSSSRQWIEPAAGPIGSEALEHDPLFPERANIGAAEVIGPNRLRLRVWERGVGITQACGSGACAAAVAAARRGITGRKVEVVNWTAAPWNWSGVRTATC